MVFKCKMCGGALEITEGVSVTECPYCGARQTLPRLDNEKRANLYDRAGHFRRMSDFDKAMALYEEILKEDSTDAEAYWSIVLCRYGIEYVEDPATHRRIPTVNRVQLTSILADEDYKSALTYADAGQRELYETEAKEIERIQRGILAISEKEAPFDVFICYKETDDRGVRTRDSVLANDLYYELTNEGYKVFFSRITLEDKLGAAYEPYIFAALRSAPVMVVVGTKPEYLNSPWVKNEWSRYLALIRTGEKKTLIPAYRDMDPYDLPDAFSHLQAQDMSKLGFMQDLTRGIKKLLAGGATRTAETPVTTAATATTVDSVSRALFSETKTLLKRAFIALEDEEWEQADGFCEQVLNFDPECGRAYFGKLLAEYQVSTMEELVETEESFEDSTNYRRVCRYAPEIAKQLQRYASAQSKEQDNKSEGIYRRAIALFNEGDSESVAEARGLFLSIPGYKEADRMVNECDMMTETVRKYSKACALMKEAKLPHQWKEAADIFERIPHWRDSIERYEECMKKYNKKGKTVMIVVLAIVALFVFLKFVSSC